MKLKMAAAIAGIIGCMFLVACWQKQHEERTDDEEETADSLLKEPSEEDADTLFLDKVTADTPLPASVDELFGDFIFNFDQSNRLQRNRIHFPLRIVDANGKERFIERQDWKHHYLLLQQDFCTVLWKSRRQMDAEQDTVLTQAQVEQIYLHSREINTYYFKRNDNNQWMLAEVRIIPFDKSEIGTFLDFYHQFASDSIFQRQHITDPLPFTTVDEDNEYALIEGSINKEQWFEFKPDMPQDVFVNINYGQKFHHSHRLLLQMRGIDNGLQSLLTFRRFGDQWRLTALEN